MRCDVCIIQQLLGGPPNPDLDSDDNVISVFINKVINPDKPFESSVSSFYNIMMDLWWHCVCAL